MAKIAVAGTGYVGLVTGTIFAALGHSVVCIDNDVPKIDRLRQGAVPFYEPGLDELVMAQVSAGRLAFTTNATEAASATQFLFIAVGTPQGEDGTADLRYVCEVIREIRNDLPVDAVVVIKSTVPVGTGDMVEELLREVDTAAQVAVVSNPEFLREGSAVDDAMHPDRIVIGGNQLEAVDAVAALYETVKAPVIKSDRRTAELIKYASNGFLAMKISFANALANVCERVGADVKVLADGMGTDSRIGRSFLHAGVGYGGSCFPKDVQALIAFSRAAGYDFDLLEEVQNVNRQQRYKLVEKLRQELGHLAGRRIALLGLAFKPETDDMREAPSITIAQLLAAEGAVLVGYDPVAQENARKVLPDCVTYARSLYAAADGADAAVFLTEWNELALVDLAELARTMNGKVVIDGRNMLDPDMVRNAGFTYRGVGIR